MADRSMAFLIDALYLHPQSHSLCRCFSTPGRIGQGFACQCSVWCQGPVAGMIYVNICRLGYQVSQVILVAQCPPNTLVARVLWIPVTFMLLSASSSMMEKRRNSE